MSTVSRAAVIGAGSWGTALAASVLSRNCEEVKFWCRREELAKEINESRENHDYLPGVKLPGNVRATASLEEALAGQQVVVFAVPSAYLRQTARQAEPYILQGAYIVNTAKGFEPETLERLSQVLQAELGHKAGGIAVLSGPNHAEEVGADQPSATVIASACHEVALSLQDVFFTPFFRVYTNTDVVGVELGGALKNIIALASGMADGMGYGDNTKAMLMTRGVAEMVRFGSSLGAKAQTFSGLSGIGDLIATCTSKHSRNWRAGYKIGQGQTLDQIMSETKMVIEGAFATKATYRLAAQKQVEMPVVEALYQILFAQEDPKQAVMAGMSRMKKNEQEDLPFA